jgi:superfamily II DNA or RNA helicase
VLKKNKWGLAFGMFPQAVGLGVTATPERADGRGLGRHADGVFDTMILAPTMRDMIDHGFLTDYRIFAPPSDLDLSSVPLAGGGDYSQDLLRKAVHKSHIVGDVVAQYLRAAAGFLGVTFSVDVESATEQAAAFRHAGVPAEVVSAKTPDAVRVSILRKFAAGDIKQLVNVDLFGEGFDLPAIEAVSMARPTQSFSLYSQQFGRSLRPLPGKQWAIINDHVQNVMRHGVPDAPRIWTLDRREKRSRSTATDAAAVRTCPECTAVYLRELGAICPYCSHEALPHGRKSPAQVDGDLYELDAETLRQMRGEIDKPPVYPVNAAPVVVASINKNHRLKAESQTVLRETMAYWAAGMDDIRLAQRRFFIKFGVDVMTAQTLNKSDAELLTALLIDDIVNRT